MPEVAPILKEALCRKLLGTPEVLREDGTTFPTPVALFIDEDTLLSNFNSCKKAFGEGTWFCGLLCLTEFDLFCFFHLHPFGVFIGFLHAMAIKSNAISECIRIAVQEVSVQYKTGVLKHA